MTDQTLDPRATTARRSPIPALALDLAALATFYGLVPLVGFAIFVALFKTGVAGGTAVLFFRGLYLATLAFAATISLVLAGVSRWRWRGIGARDAFSATVLSLSLNVCFLVVVPVTVDRSISVFVLGEMAADPERLYSPAEMSDLFAKVYIGEYRQIDRRLREQTVTGNVERIGERYRISPRGLSFIAASKRVAWLFNGDRRFVSPAGGRK